MKTNIWNIFQNISNNKISKYLIDLLLVIFIKIYLVLILQKFVLITSLVFTIYCIQHF